MWVWWFAEYNCFQWANVQQDLCFDLLFKYRFLIFATDWKISDKVFFFFFWFVLFKLKQPAPFVHNYSRWQHAATMSSLLSLTAWALWLLARPALPDMGPLSTPAWLNAICPAALVRPPQSSAHAWSRRAPPDWANPPNNSGLCPPSVLSVLHCFIEMA